MLFVAAAVSSQENWQRAKQQKAKMLNRIATARAVFSLSLSLWLKAAFIMPRPWRGKIIILLLLLSRQTINSRVQWKINNNSLGNLINQYKSNCNCCRCCFCCRCSFSCSWFTYAKHLHIFTHSCTNRHAHRQTHTYAWPAYTWPYECCKAPFGKSSALEWMAKRKGWQHWHLCSPWNIWNCMHSYIWVCVCKGVAHTHTDTCISVYTVVQDTLLIIA